MMFSVWFMACILLIQYEAVNGLELKFPAATWTFSVSEVHQPPVLLPIYDVTGGEPPIKYSLSANNTNDLNFFEINTTTGDLSIITKLDREARSTLSIDKVAMDSKNQTAELKVIVIVTDVNDNPPKCSISRLQFSVREVAPVGEVVGRMGCWDLDQGENAESVYTIQSMRNRYDTDVEALPFTVTEHGNIIVSTPLAYRGSISDMYILNVRVENKLQIVTTPGQRSSDTAANVTVNITVEKGECPGNWTYTAWRNKLLAVSGIRNVTSATEEECMKACSSSNMTTTPCNAFVLDLQHLRCVLHNETEFTRPGDVIEARGFWMYRKQCNIEPLPSPQLRDIETNITNHNGKVDIEVSVNLSGCLLEFLVNSRDNVYTDYWKTSELLYLLVNRTSYDNRSHDQHLQQLVKHTGDIISRLLDKDSKNMWQKCRTNNHDPITLLDTFDMLSEVLLLKANTEMTVRSNFTSISATNIKGGGQTNHIRIGVTREEESGVMFPSNNEGETSTKRMVVGVMRGIGNIMSAGATELADDVDSTMQLQGHIVSVVVSPSKQSAFDPPVRLDINTGQSLGLVQSRSCVFLKKDQNRKNIWQTDGCRVAGSNSTHTRCECTHLTNFAVLMQVRRYEVSTEEEASLEVITIMGCSLSIAALSSTIVILLWLRLQSDRFVLLMNLSIAIILAHVVFLTGINAVHNTAICRLVAILLHYLYLCVFTLMLSEGMQLYNKLHRALKREPNFTMYLVLGWGVPFTIVAISLSTDVHGYGTKSHCWLSTERGTIWAFVGPALTIISINLVVLVMVIRTFLGVRINARKKDTEKFKSSVKAAVVLLPLLGITWMFGVVAINANTVIFQYVFAILNSMQGMFIFIFHVVLNDEVRKACGHKKRWNSVTGTSNVGTESSEDHRGLRNHQYLTSFQI